MLYWKAQQPAQEERYTCHLKDQLPATEGQHETHRNMLGTGEEG
jgi:hypothetical protein